MMPSPIEKVKIYRFPRLVAVVCPTCKGDGCMRCNGWGYVPRSFAIDRDGLLHDAKGKVFIPLEVVDA